MKKRKIQTGAEREAARRLRGKAIALVLSDRLAIASLEKLSEKHGSQRAAVEFALTKVSQRKT